MPTKKKKPKAQVAGGPRQKLVASMRAGGATERQVGSLTTETLGTRPKVLPEAQRAKRTAKEGRSTVIQALRGVARKGTAASIKRILEEKTKQVHLKSRARVLGGAAKLIRERHAKKKKR